MSTVRPRPGVGRLAIGAVAALALALAGLPFVLPGPHDAASGLVIDERGFAVEGVAVFVFAEGRRQLVEATRSDGSGTFRLHLGGPDARVYVEPTAESGLLPAWGPAAADARDARPAFVLRRARPLEIRVRDALGRPLAGAEVRVHDGRAEDAVLTLATTGADGVARVGAPARVTVGVLAPPPAALGRWRHDVEVPREGAVLELELPRAELALGRVTDGSSGLAGIVIVSAERDASGGARTWNGFATSDAHGAFAVPRTAAATELVALDPGGDFLPHRMRVEDAVAPATLVLEHGHALEVRVERGGLGIDARVWSWSAASDLWSWGVRTTADGAARLPVSSRYGLRADPIGPAHGPLEVWDVSFEENRTILQAGTNR